MWEKGVKLSLALGISALIHQLEVGGELLLAIGAVIYAVIIVIMIVSIIGIVFAPLLKLIANDVTTLALLQFGDIYAFPIFAILIYGCINYLSDKLLNEKSPHFDPSLQIVPPMLPKPQPASLTFLPVQRFIPSPLTMDNPYKPVQRHHSKIVYLEEFTTRKSSTPSRVVSE